VTLPTCCADDIAAQYNTGEQALAVPNLMPDVATRVAWNPTPSLHVDAGGVLRVFRHTVAPYDRDFQETGGGLSVNGRVNPTRGLRVIGQFASGAGLGRYVGGLAPDVAFRQDGSIAPVRTTSWVVGVEQALSPRVSAAGYYSGVAVEDESFVDADGGLIGYGFPGSSDAANRRIGEATATMSYQVVRTDNRGSAQLSRGRRLPDPMPLGRSSSSRRCATTCRDAASRPAARHQDAGAPYLPSKLRTAASRFMNIRSRPSRSPSTDRRTISST
jgi:hypothetical protein